MTFVYIVSSQELGAFDPLYSCLKSNPPLLRTFAAILMNLFVVVQRNKVRGGSRVPASPLHPKRPLLPGSGCFWKLKSFQNGLRTSLIYPLTPTLLRDNAEIYTREEDRAFIHSTNIIVHLCCAQHWGDSAADAVPDLQKLLCHSSGEAGGMSTSIIVGGNECQEVNRRGERWAGVGGYFRLSGPEGLPGR